MRTRAQDAAPVRGEGGVGDGEVREEHAHELRVLRAVEREEAQALVQPARRQDLGGTPFSTRLSSDQVEIDCELNFFKM